MRPVGGFFELDVAPPHPSFPHRGATALTSGRACLRAALEHLGPRRAWLPFYICDAALEPFSALGIDVQFYELTDTLDPEPSVSPGAHDCMVYVNYFGLKTHTAARLAAEYRERAIIDDTQAYFGVGYPHAWAFNSARKWFGVPDGGFLYATDGQVWTHPPNDSVSGDHLITRWLGDHERAFVQYQEHERRITPEVRGISTLGRAMLEAVDHDRVRDVRKRNAARLHAHLGKSNTLSTMLPADAGAVPFCYPLLPARPVARERLWADKLFVPALWPEVPSRPARGFEKSRDLAARLLPLPIDQRYGDADMDRLAARVAELVA